MPLTLPPAPGSGPLAVAFSGGLDSTVLLHRLAADPAARARGLRALHVDHGLHPDSARWAAHAAAVCAALDVPFETRRVRVDASRGDGPEAAARAARYAAFAALQRPGEVIALAHHRDDQAETVLLRLLRGAGGDGLAAMRPQRPFGDGWLWRPLLDIPRAALARYAQAHALQWIDDPSNAGTRHDRNFLRHAILPPLATRWPHAGAALARSAALLAGQAALLADEDARRLAALAGSAPGTLALPGLRAQPAPWRHRLLRAWIAARGLPPAPSARLATIAHDLLGPGDGGLVAWPGAEVRRWRDQLWAEPPALAIPATWQARWDGAAPLPLPGGGTLALDPAQRLPDAVTVRGRRGGERIRLPGRTHSHALKHLLQDRDVPPWRRPALPLLFAGDGELLAAGDVAISARLQAWLDTRGARLVRR